LVVSACCSPAASTGQSLAAAVVGAEDGDEGRLLGGEPAMIKG
jgi:hypothetical protein